MRILKRLSALLLSFAVLFGLVSGLNALMNPGWQVEPYKDHIRPATADTAIASNRGATTPEGHYQTKETWVSVKLAPEVSIQAIVREPVGAPAGHPACLFIHGAGTGKAADVYGDLASALASAGITTLVPDKRLDTYTTFHRDYADMAADYGKSLDILRSWPGVDSAKTGLYAESEGTWISSIMTAQDPTLAYSILTSPPVYPGRSQMSMAVSSYLDLIGAPAGIQAQIPKLMGMNFSPLGLEYADFNTLPNWDKLTQPTLINFGTSDDSMPVEQGAQEITRRAAKAGNTNVTLRYYPANHQMRMGSLLAKAGLPLEPHYTHNLEDWINAISLGTKSNEWATPMIAGVQPRQLFTAPRTTHHGLIGSVGALIAVLVASFVLPALALVGALFLVIAGSSRRRRSTSNTPAFGPKIVGLLWAGSLASLASLGISLAYIGVTATHALQLEPLTANMIRGWTELKLLALLVLVVLAFLPARALHNRMAAKRSGDQPNSYTIMACHARKLPAQSATPRPAIAQGWGHWMVLILALAGIVCCLVSLSFWGLFAW
ncbi:peptidase S9 [Bombiscardovia apis]|uniref:Peptidase S9 n=1 Tax=Bombiscardovia apis TaxID=2932182 RepID=A0ABM8BDV5_9BIFI|nr:acyl-CoA thioester hydrolase/BAAT C-terminal domain-containing protein [Bombiscardovia apis]BDR55092.1 peptidase S9 [Bombiscardovia apis]